MKPPVALFKKKSKKLCLLLKVQSQNLINSCSCLHEEEDVKKTVKRKISKVRFFKNNLFYFLFECQEYYQP